MTVTPKIGLKAVAAAIVVGCSSPTATAFFVGNTGGSIASTLRSSVGAVPLDRRSSSATGRGKGGASTLQCAAAATEFDLKT